MKILTTFNRKEFILEDDEAINIINAIGSTSTKTFIGLRCGAFVNTSAIESISDIPLSPFFKGGGDRMAHHLSKDSRGNYFYQHQEKNKYVELDEVVFIENPKYKELFERLKIQGQKNKQLN